MNIWITNAFIIGQGFITILIHRYYLLTILKFWSSPNVCIIYFNDIYKDMYLKLFGRGSEVGWSKEYGAEYCLRGDERRRCEILTHCWGSKCSVVSTPFCKLSFSLLDAWAQIGGGWGGLDLPTFFGLWQSCITFEPFDRFSNI